MGVSVHDFEQFKKLKRVIKDKKLKQEIVFYLMSVNQQVRSRARRRTSCPAQTSKASKGNAVSRHRLPRGGPRGQDADH